MMVLKLTNADRPGTPTGDDPPHGKPRLFVTSAIHAREYTTAELAAALRRAAASRATASTPTPPGCSTSTRSTCCSTPTRTAASTPRPALLWRKNTNENYCGTTSTDRGADLNRNFEFQWGCCGGSSSDPVRRDLPRPGRRRPSPRPRRCESYARSIFPDQRDPDLGDRGADDATGVYIDIHSYGELVLWPWGFTYSAAANGDRAADPRSAARLVQRLRARPGDRPLPDRRHHHRLRLRRPRCRGIPLRARHQLLPGLRRLREHHPARQPASRCATPPRWPGRRT